MGDTIITVTLFVLIVVFLITSMFLQNSNTPRYIPSPAAPRNHNIHKIHDGLYLTDFANAKDYDSLKALGVRQILTVGKELPRHGEPNFKVMHVKLDDIPGENIKKHFNSTFDFIKRGPTVVHCAMGISRSSTIVIAYLMRKYNMKYEDALAHVCRIRKCVNPNPGFRAQLKQFDKEIRQPEEPRKEDIEDGDI